MNQGSPRFAGWSIVLLAFLAVTCCGTFTHAAPPNVILIITDDQGYGDFGVTGNPVIATPNIDALVAQSVWMKTFYVSPVCSPTRASLLTARYNYRTRVVDTYLGRSMMDAEETTLAEVLRGAGYATGIFGKWHLGDNYPMRAMDQGFEESLVLRGGGLAQPSDPVGNDRRYTNPILEHNGEIKQTIGYCTDVYFGAAIEWMKSTHARGRPFFAYIAPNAPHDPLHDVPEAIRQEYAAKDLSQLLRPAPKSPRKGPDVDALERIAAMTTNIDDNVGALLAALDAEKLSDNTLVIYMCDNGPASARYVGPFRGRKSEVYEGGVRSPFWMRWPAKLKPGFSREEVVAHIDVMPTILEACGVDAPSGLQFDGRSFWKLASGDSAAWPDRPLVLQTHRGDVPVARHQFMIRDGNWKLLHASGFGRETFSGEPRFQLYDIAADPAESKDLAGESPNLVRRLLAEYDSWFEDVSQTRPDNYAPPRIHLGTPQQNPLTLTRQDWRGGTWAEDAIGSWLVTAEEGEYQITARFTPRSVSSVLEIQIGTIRVQAPVPADTSTCSIDGVKLPKSDAELRGVILSGAGMRGVYQLDLFRK